MIVDDHPVIRLAVRVLLERGGYDVVAETDNGIDAVSLAQKNEPDILILDIGIPKLDGFQVIHRIRQAALATSVLVLSAQSSQHMITRCMQAGASGYVSKEKDLTELIDAIKAILINNYYFPRQSLGAAPSLDTTKSEMVNLNSLSNREMMVLQQLVIGNSNNDIAENMLLSPKTISTYKVRLLQKLNANSLTDLIEIAKRNSLV